MANDNTAPQLITKKSGENRKLSMDFTNWIDTAVTISTPVVSSEMVGGGTTDLTISNISISGKKVIFFVSGGTHAKNYSITVQVETSDGQVLQGDGMLRVLNK